MSVSYSIVIPILNIDQNPYLEKILASISEQTIFPKEVHLVVGDRRQGRAINYGVKQVSTEYIATVDDDTQIDDHDLFKKLLEAMENDDSIGMGGAACCIPDSASKFQKKAMQEIPRRFFPIQKVNVDSDMVQHPCLIMPRKLFLDIGGEDEELIRGLDPVLRKKVRDAGKRVTVIADTWIYHLIPDGFWKVVRMYYRNGRGSGYASRNYPERVLELTYGYDGGSFIERKPLFFRFLRRIYSLFMSFFMFKFIKVSADIAYGCGVLKEKFCPSYIHVPTVKNIVTDKKKGYPFELFIHKVELEK